MTNERGSTKGFDSPGSQGVGDRNPLREAASIVRRAQDIAAMDAIDWTDNPKDAREAKLRAAIMRAIEKRWGPSAEWGPWPVWPLALHNLAPKDADFIGDDLYDEIERAKRLLAEAERDNLMEAALREIDG